MKDNYDDIINLPHHVSSNHPQMKIRDRAAQFAPFAALTGHKEAISETARLTSEKIVLDENVEAELDIKFQFLQSRLTECSIVEITHFVKDLRKEGGEYVTENVAVRKIDDISRSITLNDGRIIQIDNIFDLRFD